MASRCGTKSHRFLFISVCSPGPGLTLTTIAAHTPPSPSHQQPCDQAEELSNVLMCVVCLSISIYLITPLPLLPIYPPPSPTDCLFLFLL